MWIFWETFIVFIWWSADQHYDKRLYGTPNHKLWHWTKTHHVDTKRTSIITLYPCRLIQIVIHHRKGVRCMWACIHVHWDVVTPRCIALCDTVLWCMNVECVILQMRLLFIDVIIISLYSAYCIPHMVIGLFKCMYAYD